MSKLKKKRSGCGEQRSHGAVGSGVGVILRARTILPLGRELLLLRREFLVGCRAGVSGGGGWGGEEGDRAKEPETGFTCSAFKVQRELETPRGEGRGWGAPEWPSRS